MRPDAIVLVALAMGLVPGASSAADPAPATAGLGTRVPNLIFTDAAGKTFALHDFKNKKAVVVVFLSFDCPVSTSYSQPLAEMHKRYAGHGVAFLGLTTNEDETTAEVEKQARHYNLPFPILLDKGLKAANALKAQVTPEAFVLDGTFTLRYRGRIDDSYSARLKRHPQASKHNLLQVLGELLSGRKVSEPATVAVGCPIMRPNKKEAGPGAVTYYREVLPILQKNCQSCHRPGEVGPFSLITYRQAVNWAADIKTYTQKRLMPPWKPVDGPAFFNERKLCDKDIATLAAWVEGGTPAGEPRDAPPPRQFPEGWQLGAPDLVLTIPDEFTLGPTGQDLFRCFVMPTNLGEDKYVSAVEVRPSNPRVVHHTLLYVDGRHEGRKLERLAQDKKPLGSDGHGPAESERDKGPGYSVAMGVGFLPQGNLSGWAPGHLPRYLPEGTGYFLPKDADVVIQVHFHRNGRVEREKTLVGLHFSKKKENRRYQEGIMAGTSGGNPLFKLYFAIPAGKADYHLTGDMWATGDFNLHSIMPHMHKLGKEIKVTMTPPNGPEKTLIAVKEWDYNWQETYVFKEPVAVKTGTRFHVEAIYDNSSKNPNNPFNPPRRVTYGEQTTDEMCFVFLGGLAQTPGRRLPLSGRSPVAKTNTAAE
jgi:peroxiredoxin